MATLRSRVSTQVALVETSAPLGSSPRSVCCSPGELTMVREHKRWEDHWRALDHNPEALRKTRLRRDWSQRRLAAEIGVSHTYISELEKGSRNANPALLLRLSSALRCSMSSLERVQRRQAA